MANNRPLSPHLQIYRPQFTSILSIAHRTSGILLSLGVLFIAWWFWALLGGAESYASAQGFFASWFGHLLMFVWTVCLFYHLCNGVRHLLWDIGYGFELSEAWLSARIALGVAAGLTLLAWVL